MWWCDFCYVHARAGQALLYYLEKSWQEHSQLSCQLIFCEELNGLWLEIVLEI